MAENVSTVHMLDFSPTDSDSCAPAWSDYKLQFAINMDAAGLTDKPGRRQVGNLLKAMGKDAVKIYDTFEWAPAVEATETAPARPAEDKHNLDHVLRKFDAYFGVKKFRSLKRQEFLDVKRKTNEPIMDFITRLRSKAEHCEYGEQKDAFIVDKVINGIGEERCVERLLEVPDNELNLQKVIEICRQHELQETHKKYLATSTQDKSKSQEVKKLSTQQKKGKAKQNSFNKPPPGNATQYQGKKSFCKYCCRHHDRGQCPAFTACCDACGQQGHFSRSAVCRQQSASNHNHQQRRYDGQQRGRGRQRPSYNNYSQGQQQGRHYNQHNSRGRDVRYTDSHSCSRDYVQQPVDEQFDNYDVYTLDVVRTDSGNHNALCDLTCADGNHNALCDQACADANHNSPLNAQTCHVCMYHNAPTLNVTSNPVESGHHNAPTLNVLACNTDDSTFAVAHDDFSVTFVVHNKKLALDIDTAAQCNVLSLATVQRLGFSHMIKESNLLINGVHNHSKRAYGSIHLPCLYRQRISYLSFQILDTDRHIDLLGRRDATRLNLVARVQSLHTTSHNMTDPLLHDLIHEFQDVINDDIGCLPGEQNITIDPDVPPVINSSRPIPAAIREETKRELDTLERKGIITKVTTPTPWVSNMVVVRKKSGKVRVCIDPIHLNKAIKREHYPMNNFDDVATRLNGSTVFSTLDANSGYFQIRLNKVSSELTTFITPFGRYRYVCLWVPPVPLKSSSAKCTMHSRTSTVLKSLSTTFWCMPRTTRNTGKDFVMYWNEPES